MKKKIYALMAVIFLIIAIGLIGYIVANRMLLAEEEKRYQELAAANTAASVEVADTENTQATTEGVSEAVTQSDTQDISMYNVPAKEIDFGALKGQNSDVYAWIHIPDTNIDYPILQHPTELSYYLEHNMDHSKGLPGCIYTQCLNSKEFDDFNTVVYGHNMKAGTMFANLHNYEDKEFFDSHPYIYVYTEGGVLVYEIFSAVTFTDLHLIVGYNPVLTSSKEAYISDVRGASGMSDNHKEEVEVNIDSKLLTLSTCTNNPATRYIVSAVLVADTRH